MVLSRLTKITGPGVSTDTNWVGNNADFTGITTSATSFNIGVTTIHSTLAELHNIKSTGIITATGAHFSGNVSVAGTFTYEDVTNVDSIGIITARSQLNVGNNIKLGNAGVITATSFVGDGSGLIGVASTDNIVTGTAATFTGGVDINSDLDVDGHTNLDNVNVAGVSTFAGTVNTASIVATGIDLNGDLDVDGHTNLDNVSIAGVTTTGAVSWGGHMLPTSNAAYDIGSADYKVRHLFLSDNSLKFVDSSDTEHPLSVDSGRLKFAGGLLLGSSIKADPVSGIITATSYRGDGSQLTGITGTTINNNANNRIITGSGTANTLEGEANLTFDGTSVLTVHVPSATGEPAINFTNSDTGTGTGNGFGLGLNNSESPYIWNRENTDLRIGTNNTERVRITSTGQMGLGGTPTHKLEIFNAADTENILMIRGADATTEYAAMGVSGGNAVITGGGVGSTNAGISFRTAASGTEAERLSIDSSGNLTLPTTDAKIQLKDGNNYIQFVNADKNFKFMNAWGAGEFTFHVNGGERLRIDSAGRLGLNATPSVNHEYLHMKPVGNNVLDLRYELNSDTDIRHKFFDNTGTQRGTFGYTTYANNSTYPNFHDAFYFQTDPGSNGSLATAMWINNAGQFIKPLTYQFLVETNGTSVSGGWSKLTGLTIDSAHSTGVSDGTYWSNSNQRFTAPVSGTYNFFFGGWGSYSTSTGDRYAVCFKINNANYKYISGGAYASVDSPLNGHSINLKLTVNDYVELWYYTAGNNTWGGGHRVYWGGYFLG